MNFDRKLVTSIPLAELWDQTGILDFKRERFLNADEVKQWITQAELRFVIANLSHPLNWIDKKAKFDFWKSELKEHLCENPSIGCHLEDFIGEYFYFASLWTTNTERVIVVEKYH